MCDICHFKKSTYDPRWIKNVHHNIPRENKTKHLNFGTNRNMSGWNLEIDKL